jgi:hypothetical protein
VPDAAQLGEGLGDLNLIGGMAQDCVGFRTDLRNLRNHGLCRCPAGPEKHGSRSEAARRSAESGRNGQGRNH